MAARKKTTAKKTKKTASKKAPAKKKAPARKTGKAPRKTARAKASKRKAPKAKSEVAKRNAKLDGLTVDLICDAAADVHKDINKKRKPDLAFPIRSLKNVSYSTKRGYFEIGKAKKVATGEEPS